MANNQQQYAVLASVKTHHAYFSCGYDPDLFFEPTPASEVLMKRLKLRWRYCGNRLDVLAAQPELLDNSAGELVFYLVCQHCNFSTYSSIKSGKGLAQIRYSGRSRRVNLSHSKPKSLAQDQQAPANSVTLLRVPIKPIPQRVHVYSAPVLDLTFSAASYPWAYVLVHQNISRQQSTREGLAIRWDAVPGMTAAEQNQLAFLAHSGGLDEIGGKAATQFICEQNISMSQSGWKGGAILLGEREVASDIANPSMTDLARMEGKTWLRKVLYI